MNPTEQETAKQPAKPKFQVPPVMGKIGGFLLELGIVGCFTGVFVTLISGGHLPHPVDLIQAGIDRYSPSLNGQIERSWEWFKNERGEEVRNAGSPVPPDTN
jgi:hypothetical protein